MKTPASRQKRVDCALGTHLNWIDLVPGTWPYLWIGSDVTGCQGCVKDKHVKKLRDMCNEILDRRELEKMRDAKRRTH